MTKPDIHSRLDRLNDHSVFSIETLADANTEAAKKSIKRALDQHDLLFQPVEPSTLLDEHGRCGKQLVLNANVTKAKKQRKTVLFAKLETHELGHFLCLADGRGERRWVKLPPSDWDLLQALTQLADHEGKKTVVIPSGPIVRHFRELHRKLGKNKLVSPVGNTVEIAMEVYSHSPDEIHWKVPESTVTQQQGGMSHLDRLEAESIHIIREVIAQADNPVMLYSVGKDSAVMLHLARKAFYPSPPPFPLLHVDTRWKFQAMYDFRDYMAKESGMELLVHINPEGIEKNINPFDHGSALHTDIMKTQSLKMALDHYKFDVAFGGARRDEEKSRAKERIFSFRTSTHGWDAKNQRPELWNQYNGRKHPGESIRVFPISNWTELDIWQYIYREQIPIVPLYFAQERPVVERDGMIMMVDDDRLPLFENEEIQTKKIRFRTLGCYPLTGAIESDADDLASIVLELLNAKTSERQGRAIDSDTNASMEKKKEEGYF